MCKLLSNPSHIKISFHLHLTLAALLLLLPMAEAHAPLSLHISQNLFILLKRLVFLKIFSF